MTLTLRWVATPLAAAAALLVVSATPAVAFDGSSTHLEQTEEQHHGDKDDRGLPLVTKAATNPSWAGYASFGAPGTFKTVRASWTVPQVTCAPGENSTSIAWAGIDGAGNATVEQIGTEQSCYGGTPVYRTFFEAFPYPPQFSPGFSVSPGDQVTATVRWAKGNTFELSLIDRSRDEGELHADVTTPIPAARATAEVILEIPGGAAAPNLHQINFDNATIDHKPISQGTCPAPPAAGLNPNQPCPIVRVGAGIFVPTIIDGDAFSVLRVA